MVPDTQPEIKVGDKVVAYQGAIATVVGKECGVFSIQYRPGGRVFSKHRSQLTKIKEKDDDHKVPGNR